MCQKRFHTAVRAVQERRLAVPKCCSFQIRSDPYSTALQNLKSQWWWQVQSTHRVNFALHKSANFQCKPGVDVSGLRTKHFDHRSRKFAFFAFLHCSMRRMTQICVFCVFASQYERRMTQICVFLRFCIAVWKTNDANLRFNMRLDFTYLITQ
jgi:hypothetical protein